MSDINKEAIERNMEQSMKDNQQDLHQLNSSNPIYVPRGRGFRRLTSQQSQNMDLSFSRPGSAMSTSSLKSAIERLKEVTTRLTEKLNLQNNHRHKTGMPEREFSRVNKSNKRDHSGSLETSKNLPSPASRDRKKRKNSTSAY
ncbi:uncharacterized protein LOC122513051 [Leptopilina heterotoma]|uniref:uncharacterized protein LOC122513051 n=1 Tax=Leptopilina heterotoma TaxID=63436 RepID=UPI001CA7E52D|nr:uncharacterized protein LOC122513051 [Leptopilina heterotoma]